MRSSTLHLASSLAIAVGICSFACANNRSAQRPQEEDPEQIEEGYEEGDGQEGDGDDYQEGDEQEGGYDPDNPDANIPPPDDAEPLQGRDTPMEAQATPPPTPAPANSVGALMTDAATLARAQSAGLPATTRDDDFAGPFTGPKGMLVYINSKGAVTSYSPDFNVAYFATTQPPRYAYGITTGGYFSFDDKERANALPKPPAELATWPLAIPVAQQIAAFAATQQRAAAPSVAPKMTPEDQRAVYAFVTQIAAPRHAQNQRILTGLNAPGCAPQLQGPQYIGCW